MTKTCCECKGRLRIRRKNYKYTQCGLQNVVLKDIAVYECESCGAEMPEIPAMSDLHRAIMLSILRKDSLLSAEEIRFLRKMAGLKASEMSRLIGVTSTQVSKWETGARPISATSDRVLRLICYSGLLERQFNQGSTVDAVAAAARTNETLNICEWLKNIEKHQHGSKRVMIDPRTLAEFSAEDAAKANGSERIQ